ncbi:ROK family protein [Sphingomonas sp. 1P08PE]|uniref:ROK family protein n=1 Tax=Sphingomonas sp. 1P08PE TaxID=554122 RepID=UPI00399F3201
MHNEGRCAGIAGVELGGTKCVVVLADADGTILSQHSVRTTTPVATLAGIEDVLDAWWQSGSFQALGVASFGPVDLDPVSATYGRITSTAKPGWRDTPVADRLAARYPVPVAFDTDVNGAALAEGRWGAAQGLDDYAYITVGTGVGVGLIVNGAATRGLGHCEAGHMRVARLPGDEWAGACPFHGDCVEGLAAGPAIAARLGGTGERVPADHPVWDSVVEALAQMVQALVLATGPRRILIGGGVVADRPYLIPAIDDRVRALVGAYFMLPARDSQYVRAPGLGSAAGPLGPIALALSAGSSLPIYTN